MQIDWRVSEQLGASRMSNQLSSMQAFASIWDIQARDLWGEHYAQALADLLESQGVKTILDCAGRTGFTALDFKRQHLNVSYSDGSADMLAFFNAKRFSENLTIPTYLSTWQQLPLRVPYTYDAVLCRGNALLFMAAYKDETLISRQSALTAMHEALRGMFSKVADEGLLYIDLPKPDKARPEQPYSYTATDNLTVKTKTTVSYDPETQLRTTTSLITNLLSKEETTSVTQTYPLDEKEFMGMLLDVGFQRLEKSPVKEAFFVDAYMAFK